MDAEAARGLFRASALERLSSPERLDTLMTVVRPRAWLPLGVLGIVVAAAVVWGVVARIPVTAVARGVLVRPSTVRPIQASGSGVLSTLLVAEGDPVKRGQLLGTIDVPELRQRLDSEKAKLAQLDARRAASAALEKTALAQERDALREQRSRVEARILESHALAERERARDAEILAGERRSLDGRLKSARTLVETTHQRVEVFRARKAAGTARDEDVLDAERLEIEATNRVLDLEGTLAESQRRESEGERRAQERAEATLRLKTQASDLEQRERRLEQSVLEGQAAFDQRHAELEGAVQAADAALAAQERIVCERDGRVLEVSSAVGERVAPGRTLALVDESTASSELFCVAFLTVKDGKRLALGTAAAVEPDVVPRESFGGIQAHVLHVSAFPVSVEAAATTIGNVEVARQVLGDEARIQVTLSLHPDPANAGSYLWSTSRGPEVSVTAGTTATVEIQLEERSPISFVLPGLRSLLGL